MPCTKTMRLEFWNNDFLVLLFWLSLNRVSLSWGKGKQPPVRRGLFVFLG